MAKKSELFILKYSKKLQEFICDKIEDGLTLAEVCDKYGPSGSGDIPNEKTMYRWQKKYPEFKAAIRDAYQGLLIRLIDEKRKLSNRALELARIINETDLAFIDGKGKVGLREEEIKKAKFELDAIKIAQRDLEFILTRIAPKFVPELQEAPRNSNIALPAITIVTYSKPETKGLTFDDDK